MYNLILMFVYNRIQKNMNILFFGRVPFNHLESKNVHNIQHTCLLVCRVTENGTILKTCYLYVVCQFGTKMLRTARAAGGRGSQNF